jgi:hypothetical protein
MMIEQNVAYELAIEIKTIVVHNISGNFAGSG